MTRSSQWFRTLLLTSVLCTPFAAMAQEAPQSAPPSDAARERGPEGDRPRDGERRRMGEPGREGAPREMAEDREGNRGEGRGQRGPDAFEGGRGRSSTTLTSAPRDSLPRELWR